MEEVYIQICEEEMQEHPHGEGFVEIPLHIFLSTAMTSLPPSSCDISELITGNSRILILIEFEEVI
jgi:hypothetical protein